MNYTEFEIHIKRERLIDWINQMDEVGLDELIEEYLQIMTVLDLILLAVSLLIVFSAKRKMKKENLNIVEYAIDRSVFLWLWFCFKVGIIVYTLVIFISKISFNIYWNFLNYKIF